jgi:hypothetical protein
MQYKVRWRYKSSLGGPWMKGDVIDLKEDLARAINIDSPGVLVVYQPKVKEIDHEKNESDEKGKTFETSNRLGKAEETRGVTDLDGGAVVEENAGEPVVTSEDPEEEPEKDPKLVGDRGKEEAITKDTFKAVKDN